LIWIALSLFAGGGCGALPFTPDISATGPVFPLSPGSRWVYRVRNPAGEIATLMAQVKGQRYLPSQNTVAAVVEETGGVPGEPTFDSSSDAVAYYRKEGFVFRAPWLHDDGSNVPEEMVLPEDPSREQVWNGSYHLFASPGAGAMYRFQSASRIASTSDTVSVPAGRFKRCLRIETTLAATVGAGTKPITITHYYTEWYAPGIGLVKAESSVDASGTKRRVATADLLSYEEGEPDGRQ